MTPLCTAIVLSLVTIFFVILASALLKKHTRRLYKEISDTDSIEVSIRNLIRKHPSSEIHIFCTHADNECLQIAHKLAQDFPQIHIMRE